MPAEMKKEVDAYVKEGQYSSVSEFIRDMIRVWKRRKAYADLMEAEKEFEDGKGKILRSLKDLD